MTGRPHRLTSLPGRPRRTTPFDLPKLLKTLAADSGRIPFCDGDVTAGAENEIQVAVIGRQEDVDLPETIAHSNYFTNIMRRARSGDTSPRLVSYLENFLQDNRERVWENSWVRFPRRMLSSFAGRLLSHDLLADKRRPELGLRVDTGRFLIQKDGEEHLRVPISYLLKLALADALAAGKGLPAPLPAAGEVLFDHFLSDNTSPETFSFRVVSLSAASGQGRALARETGRRYLLCQLLVEYANQRFHLAASGQRAMVYFAPQTPVRQRDLNELIADGFYRELFLSPCLSGWDEGEKKHRYMELCHQVLSRSQLQAVAKLREAGIITNNLVMLPNVSNTSLANNGTHISLGSRLLGGALADPASGFGAAEEKHLGDLAIKCVEHFLPLFVGTYSAAPARLGFTDFHPEKALGFLPHELDYTHLRMLWRRWRKKADLSICGRPLTPFGPDWLDSSASTLFGLRGDFIPDARLIDYPAALLSTRRSPALDGRLGNHDRLKADLSALGAFDPNMSLYLLYRQRQFAAMGYSGFEGRHYSLFENLGDDMGEAATLQTLVTAYAYRIMAEGRLRHRQIPDDPTSESERRQIFFASAIGIPTFFVRRNSRNLFLRHILKRTAHVRASRRYPGYLRVPLSDYQKALVAALREDVPDLVESLGAEETLRDLDRRLEHPELHSAAGRLTSGILRELGARDPMRVPAREFNLAAEAYYRGGLRRTQLLETFAELGEDLQTLEGGGTEPLRRALSTLVPGGEVRVFLRSAGDEVAAGTADDLLLQRLIGLVLCAVEHDRDGARRPLEKGTGNDSCPSVRRAL